MTKARQRSQIAVARGKTGVAAKTADETAMAFFNMAREYHDAANELFAPAEGPS